MNSRWRWFILRGTAAAACLYRLNLVPVVVAIVPVMVGVPALFVLIPPAMVFAPAALAGFVQFVALVIGLATFAAVALDGFVKFMVSMRDVATAFLLGFGASAGNSSAQQKSGQNG